MHPSTPNYAKKRRRTFAASKTSMMDDKMAVNTEMLNSWKEVAVYLGRGVRTVQRWELDLGLPVRRPRGKPRSAVIALKPELDSWLTGSQKEASSKTSATPLQIQMKAETTQALQTSPGSSTQPQKRMPPKAQSLHSNTELLVSRTKQVLERSVDLCARSRSLCEQLNRVMTLTAKLAVKKPLPPPEIFHQAKADRTNL